MQAMPIKKSVIILSIISLLLLSLVSDVPTVLRRLCVGSIWAPN
jgi:hypothetical protein